MPAKLKSHADRRGGLGRGRYLDILIDFLNAERSTIDTGCW